jgi:diadenylate cyclase
MPLMLLQTGAVMPSFGPAAVLDILLVAFLVYQFLMLVRGRRAAQVLVGVLVVFALYGLASLLRLTLLGTILKLILPYAPLALIVIFQSEIRRALIRIGRRRWLGFGGRLERLESADEILLAIRTLRQDRTGALIVLERDTGLRTFIESGVKMDARLSRDLLLSIFNPGAALHDGAVIVQKDQVAAAACFLPLSMNPVLTRTLGTRHRAAIGISEETDCLAIVVSEQTGGVSVAAHGEIELNVTLRRVDEAMAKHFGRRGSSTVLLEEAEEAAPEKTEDRRRRAARP